MFLRTTVLISETYYWQGSEGGEKADMQALSQPELANKDVASADTAELVLRSVRKDAEAFTQLINRYERVALSVAYSVLSNGDAAGDVVQEAFLRAWQRVGELKEPARFGTWLCGIVRNLAIDAQRRGRHIKLSLDAEGFEPAAIPAGELAADPLETLNRKERQTMVAGALASLDDATRPAVILRYYDGLSSKEIAELLQISPAAVDMRLSRARATLKKLLAPTVA